MKSCDEMVANLFSRRESYIAEKAKRKRLVYSVSSVCCVCLVVLSVFGFGMWKKGGGEAAESSGGNGEHNIISISSSYADASPEGSNPTTQRDEYAAQSGEYEIPPNGDFHFSLPLSGAMEKNQENTIYRVFIDIFYDGNLLSPESAQAREEVERLSDAGYDISLESCSNGTSNRKCIIMNAELNQLEEFDANENYGYFMYLYDERAE